jgi:protein arginine kinase activator
MKCQRCQENEAVVHVSRIINSEKTEHHLCEACATQGGFDLQFKSMCSPFLTSGMFSGSAFNTAGGIPAFGSGSKRNTICPECGISFEDFRKSGLFGCSHCYETFHEQLDPVLRRVQGGIRHIGRPVCKTEQSKEQQILKSKLADLRIELATAVKLEIYEQAARIRDEIRGLESRICLEAEGSEKTDTKEVAP